ncbi:hypothetical protein ABT369_53750 [Dactylosporangium sp. NPDC000244]|uniref:hypothetical protein n=1 Tax=Dactylosporangium sp. NPDC000244 TaxID=3154365 RepID=UPI0033223B9B
MYEAVVLLARIEQVDLAYQFLDAPDAEARVQVTLSDASEQLPDVTELLMLLGAALEDGPVDKANIAVLNSLDEILTKERPKTEWFPLSRIKHLTADAKVLWAGRLGELKRMSQFSPSQQPALAELETLVLTC